VKPAGICRHDFISFPWAVSCNDECPAMSDRSNGKITGNRVSPRSGEANGYATELNMSGLETMNARQHISEGVFGLRCIIIGL
jgi:hypothetical protein